MNDFIRTVTEMNAVVLIVLIGAIAGVISSIAKQVRKFAVHRQELEFKRELIDRGMQPAEIERVVRAHNPVTDPQRRQESGLQALATADASCK
jgi:hypothetical protein